MVFASVPVLFYLLPLVFAVYLATSSVVAKKTSLCCWRAFANSSIEAGRYLVKHIVPIAESCVVRNSLGHFGSRLPSNSATAICDPVV